MVDGECNVPAESDRAENRDVLARTDVEPDASRSTLWILVVLGGFLALAALWFAVFGNPEVIGALSASSVTSSAVSSGTQSDAQVATQATRSVSSGTLTLADVQGVIGTLDYEETSTKSRTSMPRRGCSTESTAGHLRRTHSIGPNRCTSSSRTAAT